MSTAARTARRHRAFAEAVSDAERCGGVTTGSQAGSRATTRSRSPRAKRSCPRRADGLARADRPDQRRLRRRTRSRDQSHFLRQLVRSHLFFRSTTVDESDMSCRAWWLYLATMLAGVPIYFVAVGGTGQRFVFYAYGFVLRRLRAGAASQSGGASGLGAIADEPAPRANASIGR